MRELLGYPFLPAIGAVRRRKGAANPQLTTERNNVGSPETRTRRFLKVNKTDISYSAAMLDAEGCITGCTGPNIAGVDYATIRVIPFTGNSLAVAKWLQTLWGGRIEVLHPEAVQKAAVYGLSLRKDEGLRYLKLVKPFLRIKRAQAECATAFWSLPDPAPQKRRNLAAKIRKLNKRFKIQST